MKKKALLLILLVAAMAVLLLIYTKVKTQKTQDVVPPDTDVVETGSYTVLQCPLENIESITVENPYGVIKISSDGENLKVDDVDMNLLDSQKVIYLVNAVIGVYSDNEIGAQQQLDQFGLEKPQASITYKLKDGSDNMLYLGDLTADGNYYYAMTNDNTVYTIGKPTGDRMMQKMTDLAKLDIDKVDVNGIMMLEVRQKDRDDLRISYDDSNAVSQANLDQSGLQTLVMHNPMEDILVYPYNLETGLLYDYDRFIIDEMVELGDENFAKYGLDDPVMTVAIADAENSVTLKVGAPTEDGSGYYVTPYNNKAVYTMSKAGLEPFFNYNIIDFIQKFVSLHYRYELEGFDIKSVYGDYNVELKTEGDGKIYEENGIKKDTRQEYINGKAVDSEQFINYYELMVGLTFDALQETKPQGEPQVTITYKLLDGTEDKIEFYDYDDTFYTVSKGESDAAFYMLINKQQVKQAVDKGKTLLGE